jgi:hypothetical protein
MRLELDMQYHRIQLSIGLPFSQAYSEIFESKNSDEIFSLLCWVRNFFIQDRIQPSIFHKLSRSKPKN